MGKTIEEELDMFFQICCRQGYVLPLCPEAAYEEYAQGFTHYLTTGILPNRFHLLKGGINDTKIKPVPSTIITRRSRVIWLTQYAGRLHPALWKGLHVALNQSETEWTPYDENVRDALIDRAEPLMPKVNKYIGKLYNPPLIASKIIPDTPVPEKLSKNQRRKRNKKLRELNADPQMYKWFSGKIRGMVINNTYNAFADKFMEIGQSITNFWNQVKTYLAEVFGHPDVGWFVLIGAISVGFLTYGAIKIASVIKGFRDSYEFTKPESLEAEGQSYGLWVKDGISKTLGINLDPAMCEQKFMNIYRYKSSILAIEWFFEKIKEIVDYIGFKITGKHVSEDIRIKSEIKAAMDSLALTYDTTTLERKKEFIASYTFLVQNGGKMAGKPSFADVQKCISFYNDRFQQIMVEKRSEQRKHPVCLVFTGSSGVGKSYIMNVLVRALGKEYLKICEDHPYFVYSRNLDDAFWSGYGNQFGVLYDDFLQQKDETARARASFELINAINTNPYALNMASLYEKGSTYFTSPFVGITTNDVKFENLGVICPAAMTNRFTYHVKLERTDGAIKNPQNIKELVHGLKFYIMGYNAEGNWDKEIEVSFEWLMNSVWTLLTENMGSKIPEFDFNFKFINNVIPPRINLAHDSRKPMPQFPRDWKGVSMEWLDEVFDQIDPESYGSQFKLHDSLVLTGWNQLIMRKLYDRMEVLPKGLDVIPGMSFTDFCACVRRDYLRAIEDMPVRFVGGDMKEKTLIEKMTDGFRKFVNPNYARECESLKRGIGGDERPFTVREMMAFRDQPPMKIKLDLRTTGVQSKLADPEDPDNNDFYDAREDNDDLNTSEEEAKMLTTHDLFDEIDGKNQGKNMAIINFFQSKGIMVCYWDTPGLYFIRYKKPGFTLWPDYMWYVVNPKQQSLREDYETFVKMMVSGNRIPMYCEIYTSIVNNRDNSKYYHPWLVNICDNTHVIQYMTMTKEFAQEWVNGKFSACSELDRYLSVVYHDTMVEHLGLTDPWSTRKWYDKVKANMVKIAMLTTVITGVVALAGGITASLFPELKKASQQSDDSLNDFIVKKQIATARTRNVKWIPKAQKQGVDITLDALNQGLSEKLARIYRNTKHFTFYKRAKEDGEDIIESLEASFGLFIGGRTAVLARHCIMGDWDFVRICDPFDIGSYIERNREDILLSLDSDEDKSLASRELGVLTIKYGNTHKDIRNMFPTTTKNVGKGTIIRCSYVKNAEGVSYRCIQGHDCRIQDAKIEGVTKHKLGVIRMINMVGECGQAYLKADHVDQESIDGIHVAGTGEFSLFSPITREDVDRWIKVDQAQKTEEPQFELQGKPLGFKEVVPTYDLSKKIPGFTLVGTVEKKASIPLKSSFEESFIQRQEDNPFGNDGAPAHAFNGDPLKSLRKRANYISKPLIEEMNNPDAFQGVFTEDIIGRRYYQLTEKEAILGTRALPLLARDKSAGGGFMHYNKNRKDLIDYDKGEMKDELRKPYDELKDNWENNVKQRVYAVGCYKTDEVISKEKATAGYIRMFFIMCLWVNIITKQVLGCLQEQITSNVLSDVAIGINPYSVEWKMIYNHLIENGKGRVDAADASGWDLRFSIAFVPALLNFLKNYWIGYTIKEWNLLSNCLEMCLTPMLLIGNYVYDTTGMMPSGWWGTSVINSIKHSWKRRVIYLTYIKQYELNLPFRTVCRLKVHGDDAVQVITPPEEYAEFFKYFGAKYIAWASRVYFSCDHTNFKKDGEPEDTDMETAEFLKRKFVVNNDGTVFGPINISSIHKMLLWTKRGENSREKQAIINGHTALRELFFHGPAVFQEYKNKINHQLQKIAYHSQFFQSHRDLAKVFKAGLFGQEFKLDME